MMFKEAGQRHNVPHFHARYAEYEAEFDFDGCLLAGDFPSRQTKLVVAWASLHRDELEADWHLLSCGERPYRIEPLR
ncbi:MAG: DUF4160 domain-containing protein [Slackia sp.]|nr:DUF4160 domain-containing protein [Slackia sp.]